MKYMKKIGVILLSICLMLPIFGITSHAASGKVSVTSASTTVGKNVTITCTVQCTSGAIGYANVVLTYDQSALKFVSGTNMAQGGAGRVQYVDAGNGSAKSLSFQMTFTVLKAGSHKVSTSSVQASDFDENSYNPGNATGTITGKTPTQNNNTSGNNNNNNNTQNKKDSNNQLSSLQIYPGTLSPSFSAGTTAYNVTVPADTTDVTISAKAQSSKAKVTVSGGKNLQLGANTAQVIVIAENGASRAYTITIMCGEKEKIVVDGSEYNIKETFADTEIPTGFSRTKLTYKDRQYEGLTNTNGGVKLLMLESLSRTEFFMYNQETQGFSDFLQVAIAPNKYIILMPLNKDIKNFAEKETISVTLQDKHFSAWKLDEEFSVCYVINQDGVAALYRYDSVDGIFQRYTESTVEVDKQNVKKALFPDDYYMYAIIALGALVLILAICMIYFIASRKQRHEGRKRRVVKKIEKKYKKEAKAQEKQRIADEKQRAKEAKEAEKLRLENEKQRMKEAKKLAKKD